MNAKTVLVTGATDGIGYATACQLATSGFRVLVHGRNPGKARAAAERLARDAPGATVAPVAGDLSRMADVVSLAAEVIHMAPALDVLVNNAAIYEARRHVTADGLEMTMAVNHFAVCLLTRRLLDALHRAQQGRVVIVSSTAHASGTIDLDDLILSRGYTGYGAYSTSKLANILHTVALARRLAGTAVTANCLHPGVIATKLLRAGGFAGGAAPESGARTSVYLATTAEVASVTGQYFVDCRAVAPSRTARDERLAEALWRATEQVLEPFL